MPLSDAQCRNAKPKDKPYKLSDGERMYLHVFPNGSKYWRMSYVFSGKSKTLALGIYPHVGLAEAREKRFEAKRQLSAGVDPNYQRKLDRLASKQAASNTLEAIAREWHGVKKAEWQKKHATVVLNRLEKNLFPGIGFRPIGEITVPESPALAHLC